MSPGALRGRAVAVVLPAIVAGLAVGAAATFGLTRWLSAGTGAPVPFYGEHQAGISTPSQSFAFMAAFDVITGSRDGLRELMRRWTDVAARLTAGPQEQSVSGTPLSPPSDTGETFGYEPCRLTMTFGAGPSLFDGRFGLSSMRPAALVDLPPFLGDRLRPELSNGDLGVQICADDAQVAFHALRELVRAARGLAVLRWSQQGFRPSPEANTRRQTARNLQGFKDGTANVDASDPVQLARVVWASGDDGAAWMKGGSYLVFRRIRMHIEVWDRSSLQDQENTIGRHKESGSPLGGTREKDGLDLAARTKDSPVIPQDAHVRLAHGDGSEQILRRPFSFANGVDPRTGELDAGLLFICFQRDPRVQFIPIQARLAENDALNEYIAHVESAIFACFPGTRKGGYIGETLLD